MNVSEKIKRLRIKNNLTQVEFANKIFVTRSAVAKWEQNRGVPSADTFRVICEKFNVDYKYFIDESTNEYKIVESVATTNMVKKKNKILTVIGIATSLCLVVATTFAITYGVQNAKEKREQEKYFYDGSFAGYIKGYNPNESFSFLLEDGRTAYFKYNTPICDFHLNEYGYYELEEYMENESLRMYFEVKDKEIEKIWILSPIEDKYESYGFYLVSNLAGKPSKMPINLSQLGIGDEESENQQLYKYNGMNVGPKYPYWYSYSSGGGYTGDNGSDYNYQYNNGETYNCFVKNEELEKEHFETTTRNIDFEFYFSLSVRASYEIEVIDNSEAHHTNIGRIPYNDSISYTLCTINIIEENHKFVYLTNANFISKYVETPDVVNIRLVNDSGTIIEEYQFTNSEDLICNYFKQVLKNKNATKMEVRTLTHEGEKIKTYTPGEECEFYLANKYGFAKKFIFSFSDIEK